MSIRKFVRQIRPTDESYTPPVDKVQSYFSELTVTPHYNALAITRHYNTHKFCRYIRDTGRSQKRSLPTIQSLELRTNLPWPTTRDTYNDDFLDILEPDADAT